MVSRTITMASPPATRTAIANRGTATAPILPRAALSDARFVESECPDLRVVSLMVRLSGTPCRNTPS